MAGRLFFAAVATFWVVMNVLLWRAEFGGGGEPNSDVRLEAVVGRVINAPDPSNLRVSRHGFDLGLLRWMPSVLEAAPAGPDAPAELVPEGMVTSATGYRIEVDFNLTGETPSERWRVNARLDLATNRVWRTLKLELTRRPVRWELTARAGDDRLRLDFQDGRAAVMTQEFRAADFQNLEAILGAYAAFLPRGLRTDAAALDPKQLRPGLQWRAQDDTLTIARHRVRVYRVSARLFERYEIVAWVSRAGEILKVTLPDGIVLHSDVLPVD